MKCITTLLLLIGLQANLFAQQTLLLFSITQSTENQDELVFTVTNRSDQPVETGVFEKSYLNRVTIKTFQDVIISYFGVHDFVPDKVILAPNSTHRWTYNVTAFFYPDYPTRFADKKGVYKIVWFFNGVEHGPYLYDFK